MVDRDIRIPTSVDGRSTAQRIEQPEEDGQVRVPAQQAIDQLAASLDDLARQEHERVQEGLEFQFQHPLFFGVMFLLPAAWILGSINAHQAFRFQAKAVISMYAQLLSRLSGRCNARTAPFNWAMWFS